MGWQNYFHFVRHPHSLNPNIHQIPHPAAPYLARLANIGATTAFPKYWSTQQRDHAYERGPHPSAAHHYKSSLLADMFDYVQMGQFDTCHLYVSPLQGLFPNENAVHVLLWTIVTSTPTKMATHMLRNMPCSLAKRSVASFKA
jgi:hypothetical protein